MIKVLLVENDLNWLESVIAYLEKIRGIKVTSVANTTSEAVSVLKRDEFDIILIGLNEMHEKSDGICDISEIARLSKAKIIVVASAYEEDIITKCFCAGAVNFVLKPDYKEIPSVIRSAINGYSPLEVLLKDYLRMKREEQLKTLTPAERQIFELMEKGYNKAQIRRLLCKSESTIKNQVNKILKKLGVSNYSEALSKVRIENAVNKNEDNSWHAT